MNEKIIIALITAVPASLVAIGGIIIPLVGMYKHRNHEKTSDDTNSQISILLNGGLEKRIRAAIQEQLKLSEESVD